MSSSSAAARHWRRSLNLSLVLLAVWVLTSFVLPYFARDLSAQVLGWPLGFWWAAQGGLLVYLGIVVFYAWRMRRLDAELRKAEREAA